MIQKDQLRAIRNDLPMKLTVTRLGEHGPFSKEHDGYFRFQCPHCGELQATVNPVNNLAHCFCCGKNINSAGWRSIKALWANPKRQPVEGNAPDEAGVDVVTILATIA